MKLLDVFLNLLLSCHVTVTTFTENIFVLCSIVTSNLPTYNGRVGYLYKIASKLPIYRVI